MFNDTLEKAMFLDLMEKMVERCHQNSKNKGFWSGPENDNIPTKLSLIHSEVSEWLEAYRKGNPPCDKEITVIDPKHPDGVRRITAEEEEAADVFIRLADLCGRQGIDLARVVLAKMSYNSTRPHMHGGKRV